jgi:hypothetical protein
MGKGHKWKINCKEKTHTSRYLNFVAVWLLVKRILVAIFYRQFLVANILLTLWTSSSALTNSSANDS